MLYVAKITSECLVQMLYILKNKKNLHLYLHGGFVFEISTCCSTDLVYLADL